MPTVIVGTVGAWADADAGIVDESAQNKEGFKSSS